MVLSKLRLNFEQITDHMTSISFLQLHLIFPFLGQSSDPCSLPFLHLPLPLTPEATLLRVTRDPCHAKSGAHFSLLSGASQQHSTLLGILSTGLLDLPLGHVSSPQAECPWCHPSMLGQALSTLLSLGQSDLQ